MDTGLADVYWSVGSSRKWNVVENGEVIRGFIRDVVITLATEISRARNRLAREVNYVKNIEPPEYPTPASSHVDDPEPNALRNIKAEAPPGAPGTAEKRPHPSSALQAEKLEEVPFVWNCSAPNSAFPSPPPVPLAGPPLPSQNEPLVKFLPVREVVDIERYDPDAPIELIPEGYVKQFVIDDNGDNRNNIILLKDPTYNSYRPKKRQTMGRFETPNLLPNNEISQNWTPQITSPPPTPTAPARYPPWRNRAQGGQAKIPEMLPRLMHCSSSPEMAPVPAEGMHNWVAKGDNTTSRGKVGVKNEVGSDDDDDEYDEDYRGDDEDEARYEGRVGTGTDTEGEHGFGWSMPRGNIRRHRYHLRTKLKVL
ncbi:hypothetical protein HOY82DRAFT_569402 [Tuber indicum]|nr:hypothetical protein HOY82DRAFT_569402 [Tuber indicum]